jgi:UDPglucose 6-dehydrogenase
VKITVLGGGYVGLVTAAGFAEMGNDVICVESDAAKFRLLESGVVPIHEPGLEALLTTNVHAGRLSFLTSLSRSAAHCDLFLLAVGTPPGKDGAADTSFVYKAAAEIGQHIDRYAVIATKSTVPVGTADHVRRIIGEQLAVRQMSVEFDVVSNPEFLKEGAAVKDFMHPERVILGCDSPRAEAILRRLYAPFVRSRDRIFTMRPREAEMTKYASNALLATKISFMNEIAELCDKLDVDVEKVRAGVGADSRIGHAFLYPGVGYGGSCFPKDVRALIHTAKEVHVRPGILDAIEERNARQKRRLFDKVISRFGSDLTGLTFAVWGLSFKPDTDDIRDAPALDTIELLLNAGASVRAYDPIAADNVRRWSAGNERAAKQLIICDDAYDALDAADGMLLITEWRQFRNPDFGRMRTKLRTPVLFDGRNQYDPDELNTLGFEYFGIGRGKPVDVKNTGRV